MGCMLMKLFVADSKTSRIIWHFRNRPHRRRHGRPSRKCGGQSGPGVSPRRLNLLPSGERLPARLETWQSEEHEPLAYSEVRGYRKS